MKRFYSIILSMALMLSVFPMGLNVSAAKVDSYYEGITVYIDGAENATEKAKLSDGHYMSVAEAIALNEYTSAESFYVKLDSADDRVEFTFSSNVNDSSLRGLDLWMRGTKTTDGVTVPEAIDYEIQNYMWTKEADGFDWVTVYEGTTAKYDTTKTTDTDVRTVKTNASYYCPYYPETPFATTMGLRIVAKNLEAGEALQISEAKLKETADPANNLMARGLLYSNMWSNTQRYYKNYSSGAQSLTDGTALTQRKNQRQRISSITPYFDGYAASGKTGQSSLLAYKADTPSTWKSYYSSHGAWPSVNTMSNTESVKYVLPDANGECWWMGDMLECKQKINHIKVNKATGTVKEVSVYTCDDDAAFNNPTYAGWVLRKTEVNEAGVADVYLHDAVSARYWMIKINDTEEYEDTTLNLNPFGLYNELESNLPKFINKGTITGTLASGETLTYTTEFENQNRNAIVIFAVYENDVLKSAAPVAISLKDNKVQGNDSATATYTIPEGLTGTITCKAFLWNGLTEIVPIVEESYLPEQ